MTFSIYAAFAFGLGLGMGLMFGALLLTVLVERVSAFRKARAGRSA